MARVLVVYRQRDVEWVVNHEEAHGQLVVRGATLDEIVRLITGLRSGPGYVDRTLVRARILHLGWWTTSPCRCRLTLASTNHPRWHYCPASRTAEGAWRGAEIRVTWRRDNG